MLPEIMPHTNPTEISVKKCCPKYSLDQQRDKDQHTMKNVNSLLLVRYAKNMARDIVVAA